MEHLDWLIGAGAAAIAVYLVIVVVAFALVLTFIHRTWRSIEREQDAMNRRMGDHRLRRGPWS